VLESSNNINSYSLFLSASEIRVFILCSARLKMGAFEELPEECIAAILSRMTPDDVGRLSVVSKAFRSAADSDTVWNHFLDPQFIGFIIPHSHPSIANAPTKKALYLALSDRPIMIDNTHTVLFFVFPISELIVGF
jgi:hypothetical protein